MSSSFAATAASAPLSVFSPPPSQNRCRRTKGGGCRLATPSLGGRRLDCWYTAFEPFPVPHTARPRRTEAQDCTQHVHPHSPHLLLPHRVFLCLRPWRHGCQPTGRRTV